MDSPEVVTVAGYASLMCEESARATTPEIGNWRYGTIRDYARVFDLVSIIRIKRGLARGTHLATCTARPRTGSTLQVCLYDIPAALFPALEARERRLATSVVQVQCDSGDTATAYLFTQYSDERYRAERATTSEIWHQEVGQFYEGCIYRDDLLPVPSYLKECCDAYQAAGMPHNFLDNSFLGDRHTSIRQYIDEHGQAAFELPLQQDD